MDGMTLTPQMQQALMSMMAGLKGGGPQAPGMAQGTNIPQAPPQPSPQMLPQQQPQMPRMGPQGSVLPTGSAVPNVGGVRPSAMPARQPRSISGGTGALGAVFATVMMAKQKMSQDKQQKARAVAGQYIAITNGGGDPQQMLLDPKVHKIFDKALKDPNSPEAQGIQQAYQDVQRTDMQKQQQQMLQQRMQEVSVRMQQMKAQTEAARALAEQRNQYGEVTDQDKFKAQQKNQLASQAIQAKLQISHDSIAGLKQRSETKIKSLEEMGKLFEKGRNERAASSEAGKDKRAGQRLQQQSSAVKDVMKQYSNVRSEIANLEREQANAEKNAKGVEAWATGDADMYQAQAQAIASQLEEKKARLDTLDSSFNAMIAGGVIKAPSVDTSKSSSGGSTGGGSSAPKIIDMTGGPK